MLGIFCNGYKKLAFLVSSPQSWKQEKLSMAMFWGKEW